MEILEKDAESYPRKKKAKGPGRPRKYPKVAEHILEVDASNGNHLLAVH